MRSIFWGCFLLFGCGGQTLDLGRSGAGDGDPNTILASAGYQVLPAAPVGAASNCYKVTGENAMDLWCVALGHPGALVSHWDGQSWASVTVPPELQHADSFAYAPDAIKSAGPGALWLAVNRGLWRLHVAAPMEDFSALVSGGNVLSVARVADEAFFALSSGAPLILAPGSSASVSLLQNGAFVPVGSVDAGATAFQMRAVGTTLWVDNQHVITRYDGSTWHATSSFNPVLGDDRFTTQTSHEFWSLSEVGDLPQLCLADWCALGMAPPFNHGVDASWNLVRVADDDGSSTTFITPVNTPGGAVGGAFPDIPSDGSVAYVGLTLLTTANDHVGLVGCVIARPGSGANDYVVVHEWDGQSLSHARRLPAGITCSRLPNEFAVGDKQLTDGTWIFLQDAQIVLVRP